MNKIELKSKIKYFIWVVFLLFLPFFSYARDYDYYVDRSVSESGDGSESDPFKTIKEAVEKSGDIFVNKGEYKESFELKKNTKIYGKNKNEVIISGAITMNDKTYLQDITARGANVVITIKADADAEIKDCIIKDSNKIGIESLVGGGKLKVVNSKIKNGNGKGFYIQRGKEIELLNNEVSDNDEEGIDIRSKVDGLVKNNVIIKNKESGIELVVGHANLKIEDNTIKNNGSSGIATQFYPDADLKDTGEVRISNNELKDNNKYGLDCNIPQGGTPGKEYWKDSIELEGNDISGNRIEAINKYCNLIEAVDQDEKADNSIVETVVKEEMIAEVEPELTVEEKAQIKAQEEEKRLERERKIREIKQLLSEGEAISSNLDSRFDELDKENKIKKFFIGLDGQKISEAEKELEEKSLKLEKLQVLTSEISLETEEEILFQKSLEEAQQKNNQQKELLNQKINSFSIWGWIKNLVSR